MKKEYIFIVLIIVMLYLLYLIIWHKYNEFKINTLIDKITEENLENKKEIINKKNTLVYLSTNAYIDYVLKSTRNLRNRWEEVIILNKERKIYNKIDIKDTWIKTNQHHFKNNYEKWIYFLFKKEKSINL